MVVATAVAAGFAAGYLVERRLLRPRLTAVGGATARGAKGGATPWTATADSAPLGAIAGERVDVAEPSGLQIAAELYGPESAPQLVLAHGWVCTGRVWHEQVTALSDRFRLITYDQPGHGRSGSPPGHRYDVDLFGDSLAAVVRATTRPGPVVLCGHSLGGMSILNLLRRHPDVAERVASVVLLSTASRAAADGTTSGVGIHTVARIERLLDRAAAVGRPHARSVAHRLYATSSDLSSLATRLVGLSRHADPRYVDFTEQLLLDSDVDMILGVLAPVLTLDEDESLPALSVPTTVVCGTADWVTPLDLSRRMVAGLPHARLFEVPGVGHMTPLEAHALVTELLEEAATHVQEAA